MDKEKVKKVLKGILRVYMIICTSIFSLILIAGLVVLINFGKITGFILEKAVDSFSTELNGIIAGYFATAVPDNSVRFESIKTVNGGGLQASFRVDSSVMANIDIDSFENKTNMEILEELGIALEDIPEDIRPLFSMVKQTLVLDFKDDKGNPFINREITTKEITNFFK